MQVSTIEKSPVSERQIHDAKRILTILRSAEMADGLRTAK